MAAVSKLDGISLVPWRLIGDVGSEFVVPEQTLAMILCHWAASEGVCALKVYSEDILSF